MEWQSYVRLSLCVQVVYVYGGENTFCAVKGIEGWVRYLPENAIGVAQWFGVTAFLFCVHSMVCHCVCVGGWGWGV